MPTSKDLPNKPPPLPYPLRRISPTLPDLPLIFKPDIDIPFLDQLHFALLRLHTHYSTTTTATPAETSRHIAAGLAVLIEVVTSFPEPFGPLSAHKREADRRVRKERMREARYFAFGKERKPFPCMPIAEQGDCEENAIFLRSAGTKRLSTGMMAEDKKGGLIEFIPLTPPRTSANLPARSRSKAKRANLPPFTVHLHPLPSLPLTLDLNTCPYFAKVEDKWTARAFFQVVQREEARGSEIETCAMLAVGILAIGMREVEGGFCKVMKGLVRGKRGGWLGSMREWFEKEADMGEEAGWEVV